LRITFHGAARQVTGSAHLLEVGTHRVLLDCGLFDSDRLNPDSPNRHFTFDPTSLDAVIVSHAHNDHIGRLPCLVRAGFRGPFYCTAPTADILGMMLRDSARIQREDARLAAVRRAELAAAERGRGAAVELDEADDVEPLFELHDVERVESLIHRLPLDEPTELLGGVTLTFRNAGHILGAAISQLDLREGSERRRVVYTGDLGRRSMGLLPDPDVVKGIDVLISESTYGGKELDPYDRLMKQLHAIVARASRLGAKIVIPAFSLGRTQRLVYCFQELFDLHKVKAIPVYVDSPLASRLTDIHRAYPEAYTKTARRLMDRDPFYFSPPYVKFCMNWEESRRLNYMDGPMVIIASSGMCDAGRVRGHLKNTIEDPDNAVVIVSYQAEGTLGRQIAEGAERVKIQDEEFDLNAAVYVLDGFSGHADRNDLLWWYEQTGGHIGKAFLVHGEPEQMLALAPAMQPFVESDVILAEPHHTYDL
jgi:metallo-beta-lactamase family protein